MKEQLVEKAAAPLKEGVQPPIPNRAALYVRERVTARGTLVQPALPARAVHQDVQKQIGTPPTAGSRWENVEAALKKHFHEPDTEAARAMCSSYAAHYLDGPPVWPMLVAPPGSLKTELLKALEGLPGVHPIDNVTPQTFISGQIEEPEKNTGRSPSLLHRIGKDGILVYPDFSTVLAMKADNRGAVLADMRRIYDGKLRKEFGTTDDPKNHEWTGRITFLVGVTGEIDRHYAIFNTLGERFVMIRWPRVGGIDAALAAMNQNRTEATDELRLAVHALLTDMPQSQPTLARALQLSIGALSEIAVRARTHVHRERNSREIDYAPEPESNTRLAQQLAQLAKGSALLDGRDEVNDADLSLVRRVAFDCMRPVVKAILEHLISQRDGAVKGFPPATVTYARQDLIELGLLGEGGNTLSRLGMEMSETAGPPLTKKVA